MKGRRPLPANLTARAKPCYDEMPDCPEWLDERAKREWERVVTQLVKTHLVSPVDAMTLAAYCQAYSQWTECEQRLRNEGITYINAKGNMVIHPLAGHCVRLLAEMRRISEQFGFTPLSRQRIDAPPTGGEHDEFDSFNMGANEE